MPRTSSPSCCSPVDRPPAVWATSSAAKVSIPASVGFATAGLGGISGWALIHPANTMAVRMSLAGKGATMSSILRQGGGYLSLYDGLSAALLRQVVYASTRIGFYEVLRDQVEQRRGHTDMTARLVCGAIAGGCAAYVSCPMEVAVVRMSNDRNLPPELQRHYKHVGDTASRIIREEGIGAFWRGSTPFVTRAVLVGIFQVGTLDQFTAWAEQWGLPRGTAANLAVSTMASGFIYATATMPLEACKNRMAQQRADPVTGLLPYRSVLQTLTKVTREEGFMALYQGFLPYYIRCGGHTITMFFFVQLYRDAYVQYVHPYYANKKR